MKYTIASIIIVLLLGLGIGIYVSQNDQKNEQSAGQTPAMTEQPNSQTKDTADQNANKNTEDQSKTSPKDIGSKPKTKIFTIKPQGPGVSGDGNIIISNGKAQAGVKIVAPDLKAGESYEVYLNTAKDISPAIYLGKMNKPTSNKNEFVLGSTGPEEWMDATKIFISIETNDNGKAEKVLAEGVLSLP